MAKFIQYALRAAVAAAAGVVLAATGASYAHAADVPLASNANPALIEKGKNLAVAGDCIACHSTAGKPAYTGGLAIASPLGTIYSTNITPPTKSCPQYAGPAPRR